MRRSRTRVGLGEPSTTHFTTDFPTRIAGAIVPPQSGGGRCWFYPKSAAYSGASIGATTEVGTTTS